MTKLPPTLRIGPYDYKLILVDKIQDEGEREDWGKYEYCKLTITISKDQPNQLFAADTVLHEILHAIYTHAGIQPVTPEEGICSALATGLIQVFRDNPKLLAWVAASTKKRSTLCDWRR